MLGHYSGPCDGVKTVELQLISQLYEGIVEISVPKTDYRNCQRAVSFEKFLDERKEFVGYAAGVDGRAENHQLIRPVVPYAAAGLRKGEIIGSQWDIQNFCGSFRYGRRDFLYVSRRTDVYCVYF